MSGARALVAVVALVGWSACRGQRGPAPGPSRDAGDAGASDAVAADAEAEVDGAIATDAAVALAGVGAGYRVVDTADAHDLTVTLTWAAAPPSARRSPGRTACGSARPARARIATLHGVADAVIVVDVAAGKAPPPADAVRLRVRDCLIAPTVALAPGLGGAIEVESAEERAATVRLEALGPAWATPAPARVLARAHLPMLGHAIAVPADAAGAIEIAVDGDDEGAIAIVPPHPYVAITDEAGVARLPALPPGRYPVHAWLPARAGDRARTVSGVAVIADADVALALELP